MTRQKGNKEDGRISVDFGTMKSLVHHCATGAGVTPSALLRDCFKSYVTPAAAGISALQGALLREQVAELVEWIADKQLSSPTESELNELRHLADRVMQTADIIHWQSWK